MVEAPVLGRPVVGGIDQALADRPAAVEVERQQVALLGALAGIAGLAERLPVAPVVESAHARERAEVLVERAVLLHQDHDVVDVAQLPAAAPRRCGGGGGGVEGASQHRPAGHGGGAKGEPTAQEVTTCRVRLEHDRATLTATRRACWL